MLFESSDTKNRMRSLKQHIKYFNFRSKIQLDNPVLSNQVLECIAFAVYLSGLFMEGAVTSIWFRTKLFSVLFVRK